MTVNIIQLENTPIEQQLKIEHQLLQKDDRSFVLINKNPPPAIVMGSSQKTHQVIHEEKAISKGIPIIQRYSAGGCVILDKDTLLVSFILNKSILPMQINPLSIMKWTEKFYQESLCIKSFKLTTNDYTIEDKKVGGNAQYIKKERFVHHSAFLWDFDPNHMNLLTHPPKEPDYRKKRKHEDFLTTLKAYISKEEFISSIEKNLDKQFTLNSQKDQTFY